MYCMQEMHYADGASPPDEIIDAWTELVHQTFDKKSKDQKNRPCIALHCVAGLGRYLDDVLGHARYVSCNVFHRAPVLAAIGLIEYGMDAISAVTFIREKR